MNGTRALLDSNAIIYATKRIIDAGKLPDAVILATAHNLGAVLITNNQADFEKVDPSVILTSIDAFKVESD